MSEIEKYYQVLGLNPGTSEEEVIKTYKILIKVWNPNRFLNDPRLEEKANEKLKEIDNAYQKLKVYFSEEAKRDSTSNEESHAETQPSPDEPPPGSENANHTPSDKCPKESEPPLTPPPKQLFAQPSIQAIYAGFWNRFAAVFIDCIIIGIGGCLLSLPFLVAKGMSKATTYPFWMIFDSILSFVIGWLYYTLLESSSKQATVGKMAVGIIVTDLDGNQISFGRANGRWWGKFVSSLILGIGYIAAGFTPRKQALHDIMADTLVLKRPEGARAWVTTTTLGSMGAILLIIISIIILNRQPVTTENDNSTPTAPAPLSSSPLTEEPSSILPLSKPESLNATEWYNKGASLFQSANHKEAIDAFTKATELDPNFMQAYAFRAWCHVKLRDYQNAIRDCDKAIDLDPKYAEAYNTRGAAYCYLMDFQQGIKDFDKSLEFKPDLVGTYVSRGNAYRWLGQYQQALKDYNKAIQLNTKQSQTFVHRGVTYELLGDYTNAIRDYDKALELNPNDKEAYKNRGDVLQKQASQHFSLGKEYSENSQYGKAIEEFTKAFNTDKGFVDIEELGIRYYYRGMAYNKIGQYERAIEDFTQAISWVDNKNKDKYMAYLNRGNAYGDKGEYTKAIQDYNTAIELKPDYAKAFNNRALAYLHNGQPDKAIEDLDYAIRIDPTFTLAYLNRGNIYNKKGDLEKAKRDFEESCDRGDNDGCKRLMSLSENTTVIIDCPKCFQKLRVQKGKHGRISCPKCNHVFEI